MTNETNHAYAELGGLLKERFGLLLDVTECQALVRVAEGWRDHRLVYTPGVVFHSADQPSEAGNCVIVSDYLNATVHVIPAPDWVLHDPDEIKARWQAYGGHSGQPDKEVA